MAVFIAVVVYIYHYMKYLRYLSFLVVLTGCRNPSKQAHHADTADFVVSAKEPDHSRYHTRQDTILIVPEIGDTLRYGKAYFNQVVDTRSFLRSTPTIRMRSKRLLQTCSENVGDVCLLREKHYK